jgi:hypothetical protein
MCLQTCGSFKSANHKKYWVRKMRHLRKVRKSNKLFKSENLRICNTWLTICESRLTKHGFGSRLITVHREFDTDRFNGWWR